MLEAAQRRDVQATWVGSTPQDKQRRRLLVAIVLLLGAVVLVLAKDRDFWFGAEQTATAEDVQPASSPSTGAQAPSSAPVVATTANPVVTKPAAHATPKRAALPPLQVNVVSAGSTHSAAQVAAERVQMASAKSPIVDSAYPLLAGQMSVQGSVLMQALIAADGAVEDLRVLSGPTILVSAAREAVRQWKFKPYLENGKPVETQARVTVNFTIKVSNNTARLQPTSITSDGAL
jgi:TonB family protein